MFYRKTLLAAWVLLSFTALNAQAALTTNANGLTVYDSGNNTVWTQDANLLGTLEGVYQSTSYNTIVTAIINARGGVIHDTPNYFDGFFYNWDGDHGRPYSGTYTLTTADFSENGSVDWWAAQAYVHYLNTQNYGGSSQWALPSSGSNPEWGYNITSSQLGELYYNELNALAYPGTNGSDYGILHDGGFGASGNAGPFANAQNGIYWSGTELAYDPSSAWEFHVEFGFQGNCSCLKDFFGFDAWAVSPGQVSALPEPGVIWLVGIGMLGLVGLKRRGHAG